MEEAQSVESASSPEKNRYQFPPIIPATAVSGYPAPPRSSASLGKNAWSSKPWQTAVAAAQIGAYPHPLCPVFLHEPVDLAKEVGDVRCDLFGEKAGAGSDADDSPSGENGPDLPVIQVARQFVESAQPRV